MANHLKAELVLDASGMAIGQRRPKDVIHHSDQGSQYTSLAFGKRCAEAGVRPSMGSVGDAGACPRIDPRDNAVAESCHSITAYLVFPDWKVLMPTLIDPKPLPDIAAQISG